MRQHIKKYLINGNYPAPALTLPDNASVTAMRLPLSSFDDTGPLAMTDGVSVAVDRGLCL